MRREKLRETSSYIASTAQQTPAYVSTRQHTSAQHTSAYVSIRQPSTGACDARNVGIYCLHKLRTPARPPSCSSATSKASKASSVVRCLHKRRQRNPSSVVRCLHKLRTPARPPSYTTSFTRFTISTTTCVYLPPYRRSYNSALTGISSKLLALLLALPLAYNYRHTGACDSALTCISSKLLALLVAIPAHATRETSSYIASTASHTARLYQ
jgi:hypothetical protein